MAYITITCTPGQSLATAEFRGQRFEVLIGKNGPVAATDKREGDGCTPLGTYPLLYGMYRADRRARPAGNLPWRAIARDDAYSDDPADPMYNQLVWDTHPSLSTGTLWKDGPEYDQIAFIGYNVAPITPGAGSAILIHGIRAEGTPEAAVRTGGCVALPAHWLVQVLEDCPQGAEIEIKLA